MIVSQSYVKQLAYNAGFRGNALEAAISIAGCESGYNTTAHNTNNEDSRGLWQINVSSNANPQYAGYDLFDPQTNANVAYQIYRQWGNNFGAWTCAKKLGLVYPDQTPIIAGFNIPPLLLASLAIIFIYSISEDRSTNQ